MWRETTDVKKCKLVDSYWIEYYKSGIIKIIFILYDKYVWSRILSTNFDHPERGQESVYWFETNVDTKYHDSIIVGQELEDGGEYVEYLRIEEFLPEDKKYFCLERRDKDYYYVYYIPESLTSRENILRKGNV